MQVIAAAMPSTRLTSVVFCCGTEVGKTALVNRYAGGDFDPKYVSTVGYHCHVSLARVLTLPFLRRIDLKITKMQIDGHHLRVQIWDTSGDEKYFSITKGTRIIVSEIR